MTLDRPAADQVEVTVFGTCYGECILVHMCDGRWLCVDSCMHPESGKAVAIDYLDSIGVSPSEISFVVATHWDTDHIRGLHRILAAAPKAKFLMSSAFQDREFQKLIAPYLASGKSIPHSTTEEISLVLKILEQTKRSAVCVMQNSCPIVDSDEIRALSPTTKAIISTIARLKENEVGTYRRSLPRIGPNDSSVALRLSLGERKIILGADLEVREDRELGWLSIVDLLKGKQKAEVFKIAHHGSPNGDHDEIWQELLEPHVCAVMTSFVKGSTLRPSDSDQSRLRNRKKQVWLTSNPTKKKIKGLARDVERTLQDGALNVQVIPNRFGVVRLRAKSSEGEGWDVETSGDAFSLN